MEKTITLQDDNETIIAQLASERAELNAKRDAEGLRDDDLSFFEDTDSDLPMVSGAYELDDENIFCEDSAAAIRLGY